jgi:UrcA family protein
MLKIFTTAALAAAIALAAAPAAFAATPTGTVARTISTAGLDLRNRQDAQRMLRRIENAASVVCGGGPYAGDLGANQRYRACVSYAVSRAVTNLGSPEVAEAGRKPMATQTASIGR